MRGPTGPDRAAEKRTPRSGRTSATASLRDLTRPIDGPNRRLDRNMRVDHQGMGREVWHPPPDWISEAALWGVVIPQQPDMIGGMEADCPARRKRLASGNRGEP